MKHLKMLGLFVMAAASMMAFASSASANNPVITSPAGVEYTGELHASATPTDGSFLWEASVFNATCTESTLLADITTNTNGIASGPITKFTTSGCDSTVHVLTPLEGALSFNSKGEVRGIVTKTTTEKSGISCIYGFGAGTRLGTLSGTTTASLIVSATLPKQGGSFLCPSTAKWVGKYTITQPDPFILD